jgi:hypothetical protein
MRFIGAGLPALQSEMEAATDVLRAVTPGRMQYHPGVAKCWAYITVSGGTPSLAASHNITSITDTAVGRVTLTIATDFSSAAWSPVLSVSVAPSAIEIGNWNNIVAGSIELRCTVSGSFTDPNAYGFQGFGDQ